MKPPSQFDQLYRRLRVGEIMEKTDIQIGDFGRLIPVRDAMVGNKVLGARSGFADLVFRPRKRRLSTT